MREIKFLLWDAECGRMIPCDNSHYKMYLNGSVTQDQVYVNNGVLLQFTGLHDKNGKEVFEYYIVKNIIGDIGHVYFDKSHAAFMVKYNHNPEPMFIDSADKDFEVIGNRFKNPELLAP